MLKKIIIKNYRAFEDFTLEFTPGLNIVVGDNDAGKTTLLEAVHLALTARVRGRLLATELSPYMVNQAAAGRYVAALARAERPTPPEIVIDLYLDQRPETAILTGTNNATVENAPGLRVKASFSQDYAQEYERFVDSTEEIRLVPTEYYKVEWLSFAGNAVTSRGVPATRVSGGRLDVGSGDRFAESSRRRVRHHPAGRRQGASTNTSTAMSGSMWLSLMNATTLRRGSLRCR